MRSLNLPLRLLTENEIFRMSVWGNPTNDARKGGDLIGGTERTLLEVTIISCHTFPFLKTENVDVLANSYWKSLGTRSSNCGIPSRTIQKCNYQARGVKTRSFQSGCSPACPRGVRLSTGWKIGHTHPKKPQGQLLFGKVTSPTDNIQYLLLWNPVPPIIANTFFERRFNSDPLILQYAHRVLAQHPVELTFFFIPQVVQALRYDDLGKQGFFLIPRSQPKPFSGYVARFIFETAKISQLFCHQIIWNMKANCYKDDAAEIVCIPYSVFVACSTWWFV